MTSQPSISTEQGTSLEHIAEAIISNPPSRERALEFLRLLRDKDGVYYAQESDFFDYKRDFPHSMSSEYFIGIARIILAFYNTFGGIIVAGVHDETRRGGHNKTIVNIERLNTRLRELTNQSLRVQHTHLDMEGEPVDLLVVPKRSLSTPPARLLERLGKYEKGTIWLRRGHEVLVATSRDIPTLFGPRDNQEQVDRIANFLPPSPSTIYRFVGRVDVLSELLHWVSSKDEPRLFLWGRGGSGKSTIAHEFASLIRDNGHRLKTFNQSSFDRVVFLSAKARELRTSTGTIEPVASVDFHDFRSLLSAVLIASDYSQSEDFSNLDIEALESRVKEVFDHENILLVLDDIDTLTTSGEGAGFDLMYRMSIRAKGTVRLLYTQRNLPVSAESSLKVPGFASELEFREFVASCCDQFDVPQPEPRYMDGELRTATEGIPLIIETIIRLRKVCGTYERAHEIFMERRGEEARRYLFAREYDALPSNNNARKVLAALAEFGAPVGNDELSAVLGIGDAAVAESIGEVLGFFLSNTTTTQGEDEVFS